MDRVSVFIVGLCLAGMVSGEDKNISAVIGGNVTLPCEAKERWPLKLVEWSRPNGTITEYILVFRKNHKVPNDILERYQGRVKLQDPQNGNASLVLKNVKPEDEGKYKCRVQKESNRRKRSIERISTVSLAVRPPSPPHVPPSDGVNIGLIVGLLVALIAVAAVVAAFVLNKKKQRSSQILHIPQLDVVRKLIKK